MNNNPRIAHLNFIDSQGVTRKVKEQAKAVRDAGLPIDYYIISNNFEDYDNENFHLRKRWKDSGSGRFKLFYEIFKKEDIISSYIEYGNYDYYIIRFGKLFLSQMVTYREFGSRIFTEHHTNELSELLLKKSPGRLLLALVTYLRSRKALKRVAGIIGVTREIIDLEKKKANRDHNSFMLSNGISVKGQPPNNKTWTIKQPLRIIFASADFQAWHGLDRVIDGAFAYDSAIPIEVHIVGNVNTVYQRKLNSLPENKGIEFHLHGIMDNDSLCRFYSEMHIAFGSLALHYAGIKEACPLKVREYIAHGLPMVYAYEDSDLSDDIPWVMQLPDDDSPLDFLKIVNWASLIYKSNELTDEIYNFSMEHLDWKSKISDLYKWICSIDEINKKVSAS